MRLYHITFLALALLAGCSTLPAGEILVGDAAQIEGDSDTGFPVCTASETQRQSTDERILRVPMLSVKSPDRCSVEPMALAVGNEGTARTVYKSGNNAQEKDQVTAITSVIDHLGVQAVDWCREGTGWRDVCLKPQLDPDSETDGPVFEQLPKFKVLFYAHGGMVPHRDAVLSAEALAPMMLADGYQPVFLIWNSAFNDAYGNSLCCVRKGQSDRSNDGLAIPARVINDIGGSIMRGPETLIDQSIRWNRSVIQRRNTEYYLQQADIESACGEVTAGRGTMDLDACVNSRVVFPFIKSDNYDAFWNEEQRINDNVINDQRYKLGQKEVQYAALFPFRTAISIGSPNIGVRAWDNMVRRTRLAFGEEYPSILRQYENSPAAQQNIGLVRNGTPAQQVKGLRDYCEALTRYEIETARKTNRQKTQGTFSLLFSRVKCELGGTGPFDAAPGTMDYLTVVTDDDIRLNIPVEFHYYGHSMGALVGNEILWRYDELPWKKVVYMAAASTIREFSLMASRTIADEEIEFHNLTLHPVAESRELHYGGLPPQGSLLEWIDELFEFPRTEDQRTLGKWTNIATVLPGFDEDLKRQLHIRVFPKQRRLYQGSSEYEKEAFLKECAGAEELLAQQKEPRFCYPLQHGDFNKYSFWRDMYLEGRAARQ